MMEGYADAVFFIVSQFEVTPWCKYLLFGTMIVFCIVQAVCFCIAQFQLSTMHRRWFNPPPSPPVSPEYPPEEEDAE